MPLHKDLTGAELHEPKGVATATSGQVYVADGLGSGSWQPIVIPPVTVSAMSSTGGSIVIPDGSTLDVTLQMIINKIDPGP